jgi:hypothetical protein
VRRRDERAPRAAMKRQRSIRRQNLLDRGASNLMPKSNTVANAVEHS